MLLSLAVLFLVGLGLGKLSERLRLPRLVGMLITGMLLGPHVFDVLDDSLLGISAELRQIALIIILLRAGLSLDWKDLLEAGRPALLMCFVPACFEIAGMMLLAPKLLGISLAEAALLGTVIAAVSPAVVVPRMIRLMDQGYGTKKHIPQIILAGASVDDVFVIVLFTAFLGLTQTGDLSLLQFVRIPTAILFGLLGGVLAGFILTLVFRHIPMRDTGKVLVLLSESFLLVSVESIAHGVIGFSGLLAVMALGAALQRTGSVVIQALSGKFSRLWFGAEILLFVLVGASVNLAYAARAGGTAALLVIGVLLFRMAGVRISLLGTSLNQKERLFAMFAYIPKATVQAAIGGIPLALGLPAGEIILTIAVVSILITAPLGAFLIDTGADKLLERETE